MPPGDEDMERARRYFLEPPALSSHPLIRRLQRSSQWGEPADLKNSEEAVLWVRSRNERSGRRGFALRPDYRLTPQSLPFLLDIVSNEELPMAFMAEFVLRLNGAVITHNETESMDATLCWITLPDGSVHERQLNVGND